MQDGADEKSVMKQVLKNCKKVENDCDIYIVREAISNDKKTKTGAHQNNHIDAVLLAVAIILDKTITINKYLMAAIVSCSLFCYRL